MSSFPHYRRHWLGLTVGLITGLDFLANATVAFAESAIRAGIGATPEAFLWILSAYAAAGAVMILLFERLSRRLRPRTLLLGGIALFTLGAIGAMLSQTLPALIAARLLQGLGGGPLMTYSRVLLQTAVPRTRRPRQLQGFMLGIFVAAAPGPWLAAWCMQEGNWHTLFALHALAGLAVLALAWHMLPLGRQRLRAVGHLDGWAALAFCVGVLLWMHTWQDVRYSWLSPQNLQHLLLAVGLLAVFSRHLQRHPDPWIRREILANRRFVIGLGCYALYYLINGALSLTVPQYLLSGEQLDLLHAGRLLSLSAGFTVLLLPAYFRLAPKLPARHYVIASGFVLMGLLLFGLAAVATGATPLPRLALILVGKGLFPVLVVVQVAGLTFREFGRPDFMHAYALKNILRLLANTLGAGMANLYWQNTAAQARSVLIERIDPWHDLSLAGALPGREALGQWSQWVEQQTTLISATQTFGLVAVLCLASALLVLRQTTLR